ncbi:MAG: hypothetical protein EAX90_11390 [Candidatus Heimdallarchaeota archaeon]|nr:hypothetical protein [Candidatus Heimdallarchaeota archaeon]
MSWKYNELFRINLAEYFLVDDNGYNKRITPRPKILFDNSALVIVSKLDRKIYDFTGFKASELKQSASIELASDLSLKFGYEIDRIVYPSDDISSDHIQFIEYFVDDLLLPTEKMDISHFYKCYFCGKSINRKSNTCSYCGKEILYCFVCNLPISFGDKIGKCSLCQETAHFIHFQEWIKSLGMCPKCNKKLPLEGIIPITEENKESFFK